MPREYTLPTTLQKLVRSPGWDIIQGYKFVTGANSSSGGSWNCTGAPADHWTSRGELYCYNDWRSVINAIPAASRVVTPSAIAQSQGRMGGGPGDHLLRQAASASRFTVQLRGAGAPGRGSPAPTRLRSPRRASLHAGGATRSGRRPR